MRKLKPGEQRFDDDRMEMYPPIIQKPYSIALKQGIYFLMDGDRGIQALRSSSEHGAIREANIFIKNMLDL
jgi:hypothetical protein